MRCLLLFFCLLTACAARPEATPTPAFVPVQIVPVTTPIASHPGEINYNLYCAHCHGYDGSGQHRDTIENTMSLGMHTVPPHDSTGHTWQHPDTLLVKVIQEGVDNPLDHYIMPGFGAQLNEQQILDIIDYMRRWWTDEQREFQEQVTKTYHERNTRSN